MVVSHGQVAMAVLATVFGDCPNSTGPLFGNGAETICSGTQLKNCPANVVSNFALQYRPVLSATIKLQFIQSGRPAVQHYQHKRSFNSMDSENKMTLGI